MNNISFEDKVTQVAHEAVLKMIVSGNWISPDYSNRLKIPKDIIDSAWASIDIDLLKKEIADRIKTEVAGRVVNLIAAEIATDIKAVLSDGKRRDKIREFVKANLDALVKV